MAFPRRKVAVFIDGCFWHGCSEHGRQPVANSEWWRGKIAGNQARDAATSQHLTDLGWTVARFWAHEEPATVAASIEQLVRGA